MLNKIVKLKNFNIANNKPIILIAGPCQLEDDEHPLKIASMLKDITSRLSINFIFKSSFDKANRTSLNSKRGVGLKKSLDIFENIKKKLDVPILTDVHTQEQCKEVSKIVDIIQIPSLLCIQTYLLISAAKTKKIINVKKVSF